MRGRQVFGCSVDGCTSKHYALGLCPAHYHRFKRHGDPTAGAPAPGTARATLNAALDSATDECIIWPHSLTSGYAQINIDGTPRLAYAISCEHRNGPRPPGMDAAHSCGVRACINPRHLRWATRAENNADKVAHGTMPIGSKHHATTLTVDQVREIRRRAATKSYSSLGREFNLNESTIRGIVYRKTWAWLDPPFAA